MRSVPLTSYEKESFDSLPTCLLHRVELRRGANEGCDIIVGVATGFA